jgi:peptidoglycan-associated lipoprotein
MKNGFGWDRAVLSVLLAAVLAAGCSKQQTVKSGDASGQPSGEAAPSAVPAPGGESKEAIGETQVTEAPVPKSPPAAAESTLLAAKAAEAGVAVTEEKPSRFGDVHFDFDKADLTAEGKKACQSVAAHMKKSPKAKVLIEGHCDERGSAEYNLALGERRAVAVKNYLVSLGVPKGALSTVSFGKERPLDPGHTEEAWAKNRRAHFLLK